MTRRYRGCGGRLTFNQPRIYVESTFAFAGLPILVLGCYEGGYVRRETAGGGFLKGVRSEGSASRRGSFVVAGGLAVVLSLGVDGRTRILQVSGLKFTYDSTKPAGRKITTITLPDGAPIDRTATYTVTANSFIATGGDGFTVFKNGRNPETLGSDLDALEAYIQSLPQPFDASDPATEQRITKQG